ncbi:hypothetical protein [Isoptericola jiangsuensis]|uniref:YobI family P-loop NTPase n=1 Tax=Isoptericola jiangsuensis TaxID=548579 RepID=UPI000BF737D3|nr:hypothetical protein [Isoptericola jiangsuensis]
MVHPNLVSLSPKFNEADHGIYLAALEDAIKKGSESKNVALTGAYGTGKSSVLVELARKHPNRITMVSLSSLGSAEDEEAGASSDGTAAKTTNQIQKEIVKQLLYREAPRRTRESHLRRIVRSPRWADAVIAAVVGFVLLGVLALFGLLTPLLVNVGSALWQQALATVTVFAGIGAIGFGVLRFTHGRFVPSQIAAGPATISLSPRAESFFDEHLDLIVYTLEVSGRDVIVFEDIDRFEDTAIFETLRALNAVLNNADQLKQRPIRFIYALRDSVFERIEAHGDAGTPDAAQTELERANRTKFFDLVVPVVPFITHRNARDLLTRELAKCDYEVSKDLIDLSASHVADMRLLHNIRNEFEIYRKKLIQVPNPVPDLTDDRLFALILYKNVHMADFEAIRLGQSRLDELHRQWRELVDANLRRLSADERRLVRAVATPESVERRIAALTTRLAARLQSIADAFPAHPSYLNAPGKVTVNGAPPADQALREPDLWKGLIAGTAQVTASLSKQGAGMMNLTLTRDRLAELIDEDFDPDEWARSDRAASELALAETRSKIEFLRHHQWSEIARTPEFVLAADSEAGDAQGDAPNDGQKSRNFSQLVEHALTSRLAGDLVEAGYINDYFALYVSTFYGEHVRPDAMNYIVHHVDRGEPDAMYPLDGDDVEAILREKGRVVLRDASMYNVAVLDHLLAKRSEGANEVADQLRRWGERERGFADAYLTHGKDVHGFVRLLAARLPVVFEYLAGDPPLNDSVKAGCFGVALTSWSHDTEYSTSDTVRIYIENGYPGFEPLKPGASEAEAAAAIDMIATLGARLASVGPLSLAARDAAVEHEIYPVTVENLRALTNAQNVSLDQLRSGDARIYRHVIHSVRAYAGAIQEHEGQFSVSEQQAFSAILQEVDKANPDDDGWAASTVVKAADPWCSIGDITTAPRKSWAALGVQNRYPATFSNVSAYLAEAGKVDTGLSTVLADADAIHDTAEASQSARLDVALAILGAKAQIPDPERRVKLVTTLDLEEFIEPSKIEGEAGPFVGLLIDRELIQDAPTAFSPALMVDWPTREAAIAASANYVTFISPDLLPPAEVGALLRSSRVAAEVKDTVVAQLPEYTGALDATGLRPIAAWLIETRTAVAPEVIEHLVSKGLAPHLVIALVDVAEQRVDIERLRSILRSLGDGYTEIADVGTKRPVLRGDPAHRRVVERLRQAGIVSQVRDEKDGMRVFLHQAQRS